MQVTSQGCLVPLRLVLLYALFIGVIPTINFWDDFGNIEASIEDWNGNMIASIIVAVPLLGSAWIALRNLRRIPILASIVLAFTIFHTVTTYWFVKEGLNPDYDSNLSPFVLIRNEVVREAIGFTFLAISFVLIYLAWRFWPRHQAEGLPAP